MRRFAKVAALAAPLLLVPPTVARSQTQAGPAGLDPRIEKLVASISEERLQQLLTKLSSFRTRNTCSDPNAPDGVGAARQWIFDELTRTSPKLRVSFDTHPGLTSRRCKEPFELRNVMAVLPGKTPRRIYVSGHYDTVNLGARGQAGLNTSAAREGGAPTQASTPPPDPTLPAPGANDDGSGTVLSMELARVFA